MTIWEHYYRAATLKLQVDACVRRINILADARDRRARMNMTSLDRTGHAKDFLAYGWRAQEVGSRRLQRAVIARNGAQARLLFDPWETALERAEREIYEKAMRLWS